MTHDPDGDKQSCAARRHGGTDQRLRCTTGEDLAQWCAGELVKPVPFRFSPMVRMDTGEPVTDRQWLEWRNL